MEIIEFYCWGKCRRGVEGKIEMEAEVAPGHWRVEVTMQVVCPECGCHGPLWHDVVELGT